MNVILHSTGYDPIKQTIATKPQSTDEGITASLQKIKLSPMNTSPSKTIQTTVDEERRRAGLCNIPAINASGNKTSKTNQKLDQLIENFYTSVLFSKDKTNDEMRAKFSQMLGYPTYDDLLADITKSGLNDNPEAILADYISETKKITPEYLFDREITTYDLTMTLLKSASNNNPSISLYLQKKSEFDSLQIGLTNPPSQEFISTLNDLINISSSQSLDDEITALCTNLTNTTDKTKVLSAILDSKKNMLSSLTRWHSSAIKEFNYNNNVEIVENKTKALNQDNNYSETSSDAESCASAIEAGLSSSPQEKTSDLQYLFERLVEIYGFQQDEKQEKANLKEKFGITMDIDISPTKPETNIPQLKAADLDNMQTILSVLNSKNQQFDQFGNQINDIWAGIKTEDKTKVLKNLATLKLLQAGLNADNPQLTQIQRKNIDSANKILTLFINQSEKITSSIKTESSTMAKQETEKMAKTEFVQKNLDIMKLVVDINKTACNDLGITPTLTMPKAIAAAKTSSAEQQTKASPVDIRLKLDNFKFGSLTKTNYEEKAQKQEEATKEEIAVKQDEELQDKKRAAKKAMEKQYFTALAEYNKNQTVENKNILQNALANLEYYKNKAQA